MKKLFVSFILLLSTAVGAVDGSNYSFDFRDTTDGKQLLADISQMALIGEAVKWSLAAHSESFKDNKNFKLLHSVTWFRVPEKTDINKIEFHKIYTYGYIDCQNKLLHILNEWYTTTDDFVVLDNKFSSGEYVVDLTANVILETLEILSCRVESI